LKEIKRFGDRFERWKISIGTDSYYNESKALFSSLFSLWRNYIMTTTFLLNAIKPLIAELTEFNRFEELYPLGSLEKKLEKSETLI